MPLILTIKPAQGRGDRQIRTLGKGTLTIGRASGNDWVLADPELHLSRTHCMVAFEGGRYVLTDLSTNGLLINGAQEPTKRNSRVVLTDGDSVRLGGYILEVAEAEEAAGPSPAMGGSSFVAPRADPFAPDAGSPLDVDPLDDPLGRPPPESFQHPLRAPPPALRTEDPFDAAEHDRRRRPVDDTDSDLFRGKREAEPWQGPAMRESGGPGSQAYARTPRRPIDPVNLNEVDFDALIGDEPPSPGGRPAAAPKPPAAAPVPEALAQSIDDLLGDFPMAPPSTPPSAQVAAPAARPPPPPAAPVRAEMPAAPSPFDEPAPQAARPAPAAASASPGAAALVAAFLDGAGLPPDALGAQDPQAAMRAMGALFAAFVSGTRDVLMSRSEVKHEMRVERTMIRARDNNVLKFSLSSQDAAAALLHPDRPGYKPPLDAVQEAFNDIRVHEMAVMAGMQTALIALLKRFDPAGLETRLQRGMLDSILPAARKARFWELFCTTYKDIAAEAEEDFHSIFGREFVRAYDAQVRKV